jgi:hypothetical protein
MRLGPGVMDAASNWYYTMHASSTCFPAIPREEKIDLITNHATPSGALNARSLLPLIFLRTNLFIVLDLLAALGSPTVLHPPNCLHVSMNA